MDDEDRNAAVKHPIPSESDPIVRQSHDSPTVGRPPWRRQALRLRRCRGRVSAALAACLVAMVAGLTGARERYAAVHERSHAARKPSRRAATEPARRWRRATPKSFAEFERALALPQAPRPSGTRERRAKAQALRKARGCSSQLLRRHGGGRRPAAELAASGLATAVGDAATAVFLAGGAARSAYWAVRSNLQTGDERDGRSGLAGCRKRPGDCWSGWRQRSWRVPAAARASGSADGFRPPSGSAARSPVIATVCSKWAARLPSAVTTVHLSARVRVAGLPERDHRLDGERHALQQPRPPLGRAVVRAPAAPRGTGCRCRAPPAPARPRTRRLGHLLHRVPDVADVVAEPRLRDARRQALLRHPSSRSASGEIRPPGASSPSRRAGPRAGPPRPRSRCCPRAARFRVDGMPCTISSSIEVQSVLGKP